MYSQDENMALVTEFLEKGDCRLLIVYANTQGQLTPTLSYPGTMKAKVLKKTYHADLIMLNELLGS